MVQGLFRTQPRQGRQRGTDNGEVDDGHLQSAYGGLYHLDPFIESCFIDILVGNEWDT
jgi:hypothetical protein